VQGTDHTSLIASNYYYIVRQQIITCHIHDT